MCSWCLKKGNKLLTLETPTGIKVFCSEICFTQCRRASFKKNKVCDWCKHVRHTVNFVDFQDGDTQLQFCSEKCLNQYKMNIFCKEAQEHLQHFQDLDEDSATHQDRPQGKLEKEVLITPELWLAGNGSPTERGSVDIVKQETDEENNEAKHLIHNSVVNGTFMCDNNDRDQTLLNYESPDNDADDNDDDDDDDDDADDDDDDDEIDEFEYNDDEDLNENNELEGSAPSEKQSALEGKVANHINSVIQKVNQIKSSHIEYSNMKKGKKLNRSQRVRDKDQIMVDNHRRVAQPSPKSGQKSNYHKEQTPGISIEETENENISSKLMDPFFQQWAASRLLTLMPQQMRDDIPGTSSTGGNLGQLGYPSNALLYSNLFRLPLPQVSPQALPMSNPSMSGIDNAYGSSNPHRNSRNESRRELLRDRDLSRDADKKAKFLRERETLETQSVPLSPSTSHSSVGTPGPILPVDSNSLPGHLAGFANSFQHSLLMGNGATTGLTSEIFSDSASASAMFQLQLALQQSARNNPISSDVPLAHLQQATYRPSGHHSSKEKLAGSKHSGTDTPSQKYKNNNSNKQGQQQQQQQQHQQHQQQEPRLPSLHPTSISHQPNVPPLFQLSQGVPPVTIMVPYPVAIPIPIPIPFPIPITPEKFYSFLATNSDLNAPTTSGSKLHKKGNKSECNPPACSVSTTRNSINHSHHVIKQSPASSPSPSSLNTFSPNLDLAGISSSPSTFTGGSEDSIMTLRRETARPYLKSPSSSSSMKRSLSETITPYMFNLRKKPRSSFSSSSNDEEAMDLSKQSRSDSPKIITDVSEKENSSALTAQFSSAVGSASPENLVVPKIHIVSDKSAPPLCTPPLVTQLPSLEQSTYSSRRSRILDAPSIPKTSRMPSPERRYVRNVPKDMVEAAKRRGLRARVKTK